MLLYIEKSFVIFKLLIFSLSNYAIFLRFIFLHIPQIIAFQNISLQKNKKNFFRCVLLHWNVLIIFNV